MTLISIHEFMVDIYFQLFVSVLLCNVFILILETVNMSKTKEERTKSNLGKLWSRERI